MHISFTLLIAHYNSYSAQIKIIFRKEYKNDININLLWIYSFLFSKCLTFFFLLSFPYFINFAPKFVLSVLPFLLLLLQFYLNLSSKLLTVHYKSYSQPDEIIVAMTIFLHISLNAWESYNKWLTHFKSKLKSIAYQIKNWPSLQELSSYICVKQDLCSAYTLLFLPFSHFVSWKLAITKRDYTDSFIPCFFPSHFLKQKLRKWKGRNQTSWLH